MNSRLAKKIKNPVLLLALGVSAILSGCSGPPSVTEGRQAIDDRIKRDSGGRIRLVQFRKTNGQLAEAMGVKVYTLEYEAEIEFLEACKWNIIISAGTIMDDEVSFRTTKSPDKPLNEWLQLAESVTNPGTEVSKRQRFKLVGAIRCEKKEKGWWVDGVKVTSITSLTGSVNSPTPTTATNREAADPVAKFNLQMDDLNTWVKEEGRKVHDDSAIFPFMEATVNKYKALDTQRLPADFKAAWANLISSQTEFLTAAKADSGKEKMESINANIMTAVREVAATSKKYDIHVLELGAAREPATTSTRPDNERLKVEATRSQIAIFKTALDAYKVDTDYYPKGKNGLNDLIQKPRDAQKWYGPYLAVDKLPKDPWGHDYIYECPGQHNPDSCDLLSMGPDGRVGGGDDICNWPQ